MISKSPLRIIKHDRYEEATELWETSVRATHKFLSEKEINKLRPLVRNKYLKAVRLTGFFNDEGKMLGFAGTLSGKLEMLFVHPDYLRMGIGKILTQHVIERDQVYKVDVNEENLEAFTFYKKMGFVFYRRSERDGMGWDHPIMHLKLEV